MTINEHFPTNPRWPCEQVKWGENSSDRRSQADSRT